MNISDYIALTALAISFITAICSYVSYRKYGRRLNEQQAQINEYVITQQEKEELKSRCAALRFHIEANRLVVKNDGQSGAKDIELTFPSKAIVSPQKFPVVIKSIAAGAIFCVGIHRATTTLKGIDVKFSWIDRRGARQFDEQYVSLV